MIVVVKPDAQSTQLCKTDEVGELCVSSPGTAGEYYGLSGLTNTTFRVVPTQPEDGTTMSEATFVRTGLLGFLGPVSS